jgi:hypothetical protein
LYGLSLNQRINRNPTAHIRLELLQRPAGHRILRCKRIGFRQIPCFDEREKSFRQGDRPWGNIALM